MKLRFYDDPATPAARSIFLAGPTSRANVRTTWRSDVIAMCEANAATETATETANRALSDVELVIPEFVDGVFHRERFDDSAPSTTPGMQRASERILEWETECIDRARVLLVWMPFTISDGDDSLPGFTTRAEVARAIAMRRERLVLGMPRGAISGGHIRFHAHRAGYTVLTKLDDVVTAALAAL